MFFHFQLARMCDDERAAAAAAAIVAYAATCADPHRALGRAGGKVRRLLALDLCAIVVGVETKESDASASRTSNDGGVRGDGGDGDDGDGGLRDACMIDYAPKLTAPAAAAFLAGLRGACGGATVGAVQVE
jgi:hypothetical protein